MNPLKQGWPNLEQDAKDLGYGPIVKGGNDLDAQSQINFKIQNLLNSELEVCLRDNLSSVQSRIITFWPEVQNNLVKIIIVLGSHLYTVSRSRTFHSVDPLHVYWSRQPRVTRRLMLLLFSGHQIWQDIHWKVKSCDYANHAMAPAKTSDIPTDDKLSPWQLSVFSDCSKTPFT